MLKMNNIKLNIIHFVNMPIYSPSLTWSFLEKEKNTTLDCYEESITLNFENTYT